MLRSMFAGVSGLRSHQVMMDVVGNNIANVNTSGYKASRTTFQDALAQVIRGASGLQDARGGTNPMQVGLGSQVASIDAVLGQGSVQITGRDTDLAIQGDGYFMVDVGGQTLYTRAGAFNLDSSGSLVGPSGGRVMGWQAVDGAVDLQTPIQPLQFPTGQILAPRATANAVVGGNLPSSVDVGTEVNTTISIVDSLGNRHEVNLTFEKTGVNAWQVSGESPTITGVAFSNANVTFDANGILSSDAAIDMTLTGVPGAVDPQVVNLDFAAPGQELRQFGDTATAWVRSQDGLEMGFLRGFDFGVDGTITGRFSNGQSMTLGRVAIATFNNPSGLVREGETTFAASPNSGQPFIAPPGEGDAGVLAPGSLEMSNVDLAQEFTNLIIAQRGFQANSRSITASDEMLADIVNLKR